MVSMSWRFKHGAKCTSYTSKDYWLCTWMAQRNGFHRLAGLVDMDVMNLKKHGNMHLISPLTCVGLLIGRRLFIGCH